MPKIIFHKLFSISILFMLTIPLHAESLIQKRVIILSPNLANIAHILINESNIKNIKIVGVIHYSTEPDYLKNIAGIGTASSLNVEKILLLKPDVVLGSISNNSLSLQQIESFGVKVNIYDTQTLDGIAKLILQVGAALNLPVEAEKVSHNYLSKLEKYREIYRTNENKKTFIQLSELPIFTVGGKGIINEIMKLCGGKNIFSNIKKSAFQTNKTSVLNKNPELIIELFYTLLDNAEYIRNPHSQWQSWFSLSAAHNKMIYKVNPSLISQNTPDILVGIKAICTIMQIKR